LEVWVIDSSLDLILLGLFFFAIAKELLSRSANYCACVERGLLITIAIPWERVP
jgi:hypothetical protein